MNLFADRGFATINGYEAEHLKSMSMTVNENLSRADHMTRNRRSSGFKRGNKHISISLEFDVPSRKAAFDLAVADPDAEVNLVFECGGERFTILDLGQSSMGINTSVGDATKNFEYEAIDIVNENGTSVNAVISLG